MPDWGCDMCTDELFLRTASTAWVAATRGPRRAAAEIFRQYMGYETFAAAMWAENPAPAARLYTLPERRIAADGVPYTYLDFVEWYGVHASRIWDNVVL